MAVDFSLDIAFVDYRRLASAAELVDVARELYQRPALTPSQAPLPERPTEGVDDGNHRKTAGNLTTNPSRVRATAKAPATLASMATEIDVADFTNFG